MSVVLAMIPIAIAAIGTISTKETNDLAGNRISMKTRIRNQELLKKALENLGCQSVYCGNQVQLAVEETNIAFVQGEDQVFTAHFYGSITAEQAENFLNHLHDEYLRVVQEEVYLKLKQRAHERGLILESEHVEADQSIVLTFSITEGT